jgi:hypothetical protein
MTPAEARFRTEEATTQVLPRFPANGAFVVQFSEAPAGAPRERGRAEHVVSGASAEFTNAEELVAFLRATLERGAAARS